MLALTRDGRPRGSLRRHRLAALGQRGAAGSGGASWGLVGRWGWSCWMGSGVWWDPSQAASRAGTHETQGLTEWQGRSSAGELSKPGPQAPVRRSARQGLPAPLRSGPGEEEEASQLIPCLNRNCESQPSSLKRVLKQPQLGRTPPGGSPGYRT